MSLSGRREMLLPPPIGRREMMLPPPSGRRETVLRPPLRDAIDASRATQFSVVAIVLARS
jgi:hypothetical protein